MGVHDFALEKGHSYGTILVDRLAQKAMERALGAKLAEETYEVPADFDLDRELRTAWGIIWGEDTVEVPLRFQGSAVRRLKESLWHRSQAIEDRPDGGCLMTLRVASTLELRSWVLGWGDQVGVLAPEGLDHEAAEGLDHEAAKRREGAKHEGRETAVRGTLTSCPSRFAGSCHSVCSWSKDLESYLFDTVRPRFHAQGYLTAFDFFCIIIWKANRSKSRLAKRLMSHGSSNGSLEQAVRMLTAGLAGQPTPKDRMRHLFEEWSLWLPMASAILTVLYPEGFTIYDTRVCDELGRFHSETTVKRSYSRVPSHRACARARAGV